MKTATPTPAPATDAPAVPPTVGRVVHYYAEGNSPEEEMTGPFAGIITALCPDDPGQPVKVDLIAFRSGQQVGMVKTFVMFSEQPKKHHWCWPPRV